MLASHQIDDLKKELKFKTSRSGGKGGQNVNKVETKVELLFDVQASQALKTLQKEVILTKLSSRIDDKGLLHLSDESTRSQLANKEKVVERLVDLLNKALVREKPRKPTKPTKASKKKRVDFKKRKGETKQLRKKVY